MPAVPFCVPHDLAPDRAAERLLVGVPKLEKAIPGGAHVTATRVGDDGMQLRIAAMGQVIGVDAVLTPTTVEGTVQVPLTLSLMKGQIAQMVETSVARMLGSRTA